MSNKIEIGEYVRLKNGKIEKMDKDETERLTTFPDNITKHSKNIIDLIEVGDFVNGFIVNDTDKEMVSCCEYEIEFFNEDIKSILTHERYDQNCYEVED